MDTSLCETSEIPEILLKKCCTEVLGLDEFDEQIFAKRIERIDVPYKGLLLFNFTEGEVVSKEWRSTARTDRWTDELKSKVRESRRKYLLKGIGPYSPFTNRIKCGCCGEYVKRQSEHKSVNHKVFWRCHNRCGIKGILEEELKTLSAEAIGIKEFDGELFMRSNLMEGYLGHSRIEFLRKTIRHCLTQATCRASVGIDIQVAENAEATQVVDASNVVIVYMCYKHAVKRLELQGHQLHPNIRSAVD